MYWESKPDTSNYLVKDAISKKTFSSIIRHNVFVTNDLNPNDKFWKVRPLFDQLNQSAQKWVKHPENVCIDEAIIKYYGSHPLK